MSIFGKKSKDSKDSSESPKEEKKGDFFGKEGYLSRRELRYKLEKASPEVPGSKKWFTKQERMGLEKELFGRERYGFDITRQEFKCRLDKLKEERFRAKTSKEKLDIERKINFLKKLGGS